MLNTLNEAAEETWAQIAPLLDGAMEELGEKDHAALVLRFFENRNYREVGVALGTSEDAAKMRVNRALERLRNIFNKQGFRSTSVIIAGSILSNSVQAAPATLSKSVAAAAIAKGATASASTLTLTKGALKLMAWTNVKTAIAVAAGILLLAGAAGTVTVKEIIPRHREDVAWSQITRAIQTQSLHLLQTVPPVVSVRPSKFYFGKAELGWDFQGGKILWLTMPAPRVFGNAFGVIRDRIINRDLLPSGRYDVAVMLPDHQFEAVQAAAEEKFGVTATRITVQTNVLVLTVANPNAPGLKPSTDSGGLRGPVWKGGYVKFFNVPVYQLTYRMELQYEIPIIDETGLTNRFDINVKWDRRNLHPDIQTVEQVALDQLGLKLTPAVRPVEMLELEKAK